MAGGSFGRYRLDELIGRGGMGEVYRAFDTVRGRQVALKVLPEKHRDDQEFTRRFKSESALVARMGGPHIVPVHDYGEIDGRLFIDMRLVDGVDLATLLEGHGALSPRRTVVLVEQISSALDLAHREGLVHRDIKPSNVLVTTNAHNEDHVYLVDFGIAQTSTTPGLTATGAVVGTFDYLAPERFERGHGDHRVDVYALGCVLFELLTGDRPFPLEGLPALMHAHMHSQPPRASEVAAVSAGFDDVIARAMAKNPEQRYSTAGGLAAAARAVLDRAPATPPNDPNRIAGMPSRRQTVPELPTQVPAPPADMLDPPGDGKRAPGCRVLAGVALFGLLSVLDLVYPVFFTEGFSSASLNIVGGLVLGVPSLVLASRLRRRMNQSELEYLCVLRLVAAVFVAVSSVGDNLGWALYLLLLVLYEAVAVTAFVAVGPQLRHRGRPSATDIEHTDRA